MTWISGLAVFMAGFAVGAIVAVIGLLVYGCLLKFAEMAETRKDDTHADGRH